MLTGDVGVTLARVALLVRRLLWRRRIRALADATLRAFDQAAFVNRFRPFWNPFPTDTPSKFLDLRRWLPETAFRALVCGVDTLPRGSRVLDLGCGTGYFLLLCRQLGHETVGVDLDDDPLFNEMTDHLGLTRVVHRIRAGRPLPELGRPFDLVTAFLTCFDRHDDRSPWTDADWRCFLLDLRGRVMPGGRCVFLLNRNPVTGTTTARAIRRALDASPGFHMRSFNRYVILTAV